MALDASPASAYIRRMDYVDKMIATRSRNRRIVAMVDRLRSQSPFTKDRGLSATARKFKLSRQRIEQIYKKAKANGIKAVSTERG